MGEGVSARRRSVRVLLTDDHGPQRFDDRFRLVAAAPPVRLKDARPGGWLGACGVSGEAGGGGGAACVIPKLVAGIGGLGLHGYSFSLRLSCAYARHGACACFHCTCDDLAC